MAAQKRGLNRTTSSQDIAAFSLFIHFLKDIKNIIIEPDKTSADNVIHTTSNKIIANQHKSIQNRSNINMPANGTKKIEEAVSEMLKKHSAGDQILINASILVASTNGMFNNGDVVISPGEIVSLPVTNKSQKIIGMSVHFDKNDVLDWATKKIGNRNTELVNHLLDIFDVIFERFCELRNEENEIVVSKEVFIKTFLWLP